MSKFRKKPVVIEAEQLVGGCYETMVKHIGEEPGEKYGYVFGTMHPFSGPVSGLQSASMVNGFEMWIKTLEGIMTASYGDWVIKGVNGEFYPCKPDIFEKTYEPAE